MIGKPLRYGLTGDVKRNRSGDMGFPTGKAKTAGEYLLRRFEVG